MPGIESLAGHRGQGGWSQEEQLEESRMATLAEIKQNPEAYLGPSGDETDYRLFIEAVETLVAAGMPETRAMSFVWNDGDFLPIAGAIVNGGWAPTHRITHGGKTEYVMRGDTGGLYTLGEWMTSSNADWEIEDGDGCVYFQGRVPLGEYDVEEL